MPALRELWAEGPALHASGVRQIADTLTVQNRGLGCTKKC